MSNHNKHDVLPTVENMGLIHRVQIADGCTRDALKKHQVEVEQVTSNHLAEMADYADRDVHMTTPNAGLVMIGPACGGFRTQTGDTVKMMPFIKAYNASMAALDAKLAELDAKTAALTAALAVLEKAKKK